MNEQQQVFNFQLTLDEVNTILGGLGSMPYQQVFQLIHKLQSQAQEQMNGETGENIQIQSN